MEIAIFKELTTEEHIQQLEEASKKYDGLYVDMENKEERKFVKDKAYDIQQLLKKLDRKRIDESKQYKIKVEAEAAAIKQRLEAANAPFTLLINQYKAERAKILAEEKAKKEAAELLIQIEDDHETALMQNKIFDIEEKERKIHEAEQQAKLKAEAEEQARKRLIIEQQKEIERQQKEKEAREANIKHVTSIKTAAKQSLMQHAGLTEEQAIATVKAICANTVKNVTINF